MMVAKEKSKRTAELAYVVYALKEVEKQWRCLNEYVAELLSEDFMHPKAYVKLLFDDNTLSQSRLYFWIIGCLNEFDVSIEDNIKQWKLFQEARVTPFLKPLKNKSEEELGRLQTPEKELQDFQDLDKEAGEVRQSLEDLQSQFQTKLKKVQALRDGVSCVLIVLSPYSTCPSSIYRAGSIADNLMLLSCSMPVPSSRVDPRPD